MVDLIIQTTLALNILLYHAHGLLIRNILDVMDCEKNLSDFFKKPYLA
jgi:hypothetical protein